MTKIMMMMMMMMITVLIMAIICVAMVMCMNGDIGYDERYFLWRNLNSETVVGCASVLMKTISLLARAAPNLKANSFLVRTSSHLTERA